MKTDPFDRMIHTIVLVAFLTSIVIAVGDCKESTSVKLNPRKASPVAVVKAR